jgi:hypothetical protein
MEEANGGTLLAMKQKGKEETQFTLRALTKLLKDLSQVLSF